MFIYFLFLTLEAKMNHINFIESITNHYKISKCHWKLLKF